MVVKLCIASVIALMVLSFLTHTAPVTYAQSADTSQLITWSCTGSPCPWGTSLTGQALVWPASMEPVTARLGYTTSDGIYLPAIRAAGITISVTAGTATIYSGLPDESSHQVLATLSAGQSFLLTDLATDTVVSVQADNEFIFLITDVPTPTLTPTQGATPTPTPTPNSLTITPLPTIATVDFADVMTNLSSISAQAGALWEPDNNYGYLFLSLAGFFLFVFVGMFVRSMAWRAD